MEIFIDDLQKVDAVGAYNSMFDFKKAIPFTELYINKLYSPNYYDWEKEEQIIYKNTWDNFCLNANFFYDNGYGGNEIPMDLIVVGKDFWLERHTYDGAEWWEYKEIPEEPEDIRELDVFF